VQVIVLFKGYTKITPMDVSLSGTIDQKTYLKKFRGASASLAPPGSAYDWAYSISGLGQKDQSYQFQFLLCCR